MTLDEAIKHAEKVMAENLEKTKGRNAGDPIAINCFECAEEYRQLADWLKELKQLRDQSRWIPVSERLPEDYELVLFSTKTDRVFEGRYFDDNTDRQWYAFRDETFAWNNIVTAWMPLPEPYEPQEKQCANCNHYGKLSLDCGRCDDDCSMFEPQERSN